jgi:methylmalonyl-CoA carboxyltransferase large subunit
MPDGLAIRATKERHDMESEATNWAQVREALGTICQELARLKERVAALEAAAGVKTVVPAPVSSPPQQAGLSEELILVISAAVAAFLGKKPHIRQIRLLGAAAWSQQGRVTMQASHNLPVRHG